MDITFRDPVLSRPTDHYLVGVDNLTLCSSALSMIEPRSDTHHTDLIRIVRKPTPFIDDYQNATGAAPGGDITLAQSLQDSGRDIAWIYTDVEYARIPSTVVITSVQELLDRLNAIASIITQKMRTGLTTRPDPTGGNAHVFLPGYAPAAGGEQTEHVLFRLNRAGQITIVGSAAFWTCFAIEVPTLQNQYGFIGSTIEKVGPHYYSAGRRYLTVNPAVTSGDFSFGIMVAQRIEPVDPANRNVTLRGNASRVLVLRDPQFEGAYDDDWNPTGDNNTWISRGQGDNPAAHVLIAVVFRSNVLSGLDRRIALELGTSLPIKNSPMVDHQQESPDFVVGRWFYKPNQELHTNDRGGFPMHATAISTTVEYQKASDRVVYHELMPQQKLQTLRTRLYARVRKFNEASETFSMRVIQLPTATTDWWHARLHFVSKD